MMDLGVYLFVFILVIWSFLDMNLMFFIRFGMFSAIASSSTFSVLFWYSHYTHVGVLNGVPHSTEALFISLHFFPLVFKLHDLY